ncbi:MAG: sugar phosphorylase [Pseudomonadota bacterium]
MLETRLKTLLRAIYPEHDIAALTLRVMECFFPDNKDRRDQPREPDNHGVWSEDDVVLITYGNSIISGEHKPLDLLRDFLDRYCMTGFSGVHILPFFPFTSDEGFSVTDYERVNPVLGDWPDIERIGSDFKLMSDLVLNHVSSQGAWFSAYLQQQEPYKDYFLECDPDEDLSDVVRPRTSDLLRRVETASGPRHVWCTFSHDQVDLNFANPDVLIEFLNIIRLHMSYGVKIIRLDAIAFIWKELGTPCIHQAETHSIVQLIRLLLDFHAEPIVLLTETNVPNAENISYFGMRNEAHSIYNFSLPPLLAHALIKGTSTHLNAWQMAMPPAPLGCAYLNFSASHDGIGMRPAEGLLPETDIDLMLDKTREHLGEVSMRTMPDGSERPYELNITLFDLLTSTIAGADEFHFERFICSQTIVLALEGIPAIYIHALLATENDYEAVEKTSVKRSINRHRWHYPELQNALSDPEAVHSRSLQEISRRAAIRRSTPAFHPNATQYTIQLDEAFFGFWRQSLTRDQSVFAVHNLTNQEQNLPPRALNLIAGHAWSDLLNGEQIDPLQTEIVFAPYQCRWITNT